MAGKDLRRRLTVAGAGIPVGIALIYSGVWVVAITLSILTALGARELFVLAERSGWRAFQLLGVSASVLLVLSAARFAGVAAWGPPALCIILALCLVSLAAAVFLRRADERPLACVGVTVVSAVYLGVTMAFGVHLRGFPGIAGRGPGWDGAILLIFPIFIAWIGDTAAYFAGHRWGRRKLMPAVSPGKTVAGAVGGLLGALVAAVAFAGALMGPFTGADLAWPAAAAVGLLVGCVAQVGDLAESLLKREAGVKDSGGLFPGHGGVLDRFDSVLFSVPVTYALLAFLLDP